METWENVDANNFKIKNERLANKKELREAKANLKAIILKLRADIDENQAQIDKINQFLGEQ